MLVTEQCLQQREKPSLSLLCLREGQDFPTRLLLPCTQEPNDLASKNCYFYYVLCFSNSCLSSSKGDLISIPLGRFSYTTFANFPVSLDLLLPESINGKSHHCNASPR